MGTDYYWYVDFNLKIKQISFLCISQEKDFGVVECKPDNSQWGYVF